ncbi:MAG: hypothetical protein L3K07_02670 [Thermoplasmata archaeon]|nr:hypothetical protein [Thermoplasmata archaeon]
MSETAALVPETMYRGLRRRVLDYYFAVAGVSLAGIALLVVYVLTLGPIVGPGIEESFGLATALLFLLSALLVHLVDRTYREWPEGRRVHPAPPRLLGDWDVVRAIKVAVVIGAALLLAYLFGGILA